MYKFDRITSVDEMKDVSMYVRIYNEAKLQNRDLLEAEFRDYALANYNCEISVYECLTIRQNLNYITGSETVPTLSELDSIINAYTKYAVDRASTLYKDVKQKETLYNEQKHISKGNASYSSRELESVGEFASAKIVSLLLVCIIGAICSAIILTLACYPFLSKINVNLDLFFIKNSAIIVYGISFLIALILSVVVFYFCFKKKINETRNVVELYNSALPVCLCEKSEFETALAEFNNFFAKLKFVKEENGKFIGEEKIFYYLRLDSNWRTRDVLSSAMGNDSKDFIKKQSLKNKVEAKLDGKRIVKISSWDDEESSVLEKKLMNKDLVARVTVLVDSFKSNNVTDCKEFDELTDLYCNSLSGENRDKRIVNEVDQIEAYKYYLEMVHTLEKYETLCKEKFGLDYASENYSYRVATDEEKNYMLRYIFSLVDDQIVKDDYASKVEKKLMSLYNSIKEDDMKKINYRSELYDLYFDFLQKFAKLISKKG